MGGGAHLSVVTLVNGVMDYVFSSFKSRVMLGDLGLKQL